MILGVAEGDVGQVAGDRLTGFYRSQSGVLPLRSFGAARVGVEAYSWGGPAVGFRRVMARVARVLWLLLIPFALVNLAYWARLEVGGDTGRAHWGARVVRWSGLLLSLVAVLVPCFIGVDLIAWQCYRFGVDRCTRLPDWLMVVAGWSPSQRIALGTVLPMFVVAMLWWASSRGRVRYPPQGRSASDTRLAGDRGHVLSHPLLWVGMSRTRRLQQLHVAALVSMVVTFSGAHVLLARTGGSWVWGAAVTTGLAVVLLAGCVAVSAISHSRDLEGGDWSGSSLVSTFLFRAHLWWEARWVVWVALTVYAAHVWALVGSPIELDESQPFHGRNAWWLLISALTVLMCAIAFVLERCRSITVILLVASLVALAVVFEALVLTGRMDSMRALVAAFASAWVLLLLATIWHYHRARLPAVAWGGAGSAIFLGLGLWTAFLFASGAVLVTCDYLNGPDRSAVELTSSAGERAAPLSDRPPGPQQLIAKGAVRVRGANLLRGGEETSVLSGRVTVDGLQELRDDGISGLVGSEAINRPAELLLPKSTVELEDSCLSLFRGKRIGSCGPEDRTFAVANTLPVASGKLLLTPRAGVVVTTKAPPQPPLAVPGLLIWVPFAQLVYVVAVLPWMLWWVMRYRRRAGQEIADYARSSVSNDDGIPRLDVEACVETRQRAGLVHRTESLTDLAVASGASAPVVVLMLSATGQSPRAMGGWVESVGSVAVLLVVLGATALVVLGSRLGRSQGAQRGAGVVWDAVTFWPQAGHPRGRLATQSGQ